VLAFDIAQFFPSLNHNVLIFILDRFGFNDKVVQFFSNYLVDRKTKYSVNGDCSDMYDSNVGVGQGSVLSPILSTLYIAPIFHMLNLWIANHSSVDSLPLSSFLSFVDNGLLIAMDSSYTKTHDTLRLAYTHILSLFRDFGLIMEHSKTELFNFALSPGDTRLLSPSMDLGFMLFTGENRLVAKKTW
jgi:retron-type reverse transcriptase